MNAVTDETRRHMGMKQRSPAFKLKLGHDYNPSTFESEAGGLPLVPGSLAYIETLSPKREGNNQTD